MKVVLSCLDDSYLWETFFVNLMNVRFKKTQLTCSYSSLHYQTNRGRGGHVSIPGNVYNVQSTSYDSIS